VRALSFSLPPSLALGSPASHPPSHLRHLVLFCLEPNELTLPSPTSFHPANLLISPRLARRSRSRTQMIRAISGPLRSRRIHIGMDEAHGVSEGRYRQLFGYKDSTQVVRRSSLTGFPRPSSACRARSKVERHVVRRTDSVPTVHAVHRALEARRRDLSGAPARAHDLVRQCVTLSFSPLCTSLGTC